MTPDTDTPFRSKFEADVVGDLVARNPELRVADHYEAVRLRYTVPAREATYTPDLFFPAKKLVIELKGRFRTVAERQKYIHFAKSNPDVTIKFVLMREGVSIGGGSKTTQEQWLRKQGFEVAIGSVPQEWIND